jgi:hypothetical protein
MLRMPVVLLALFLLVVTSVERTVASQPTQGPTGHWVGALEAGQTIGVEIDLTTKSAGVWYGTISIPSQGTKGVPLADLTVKDNTISFAIKGAPGDPNYSGTLSADGKTITGTFNQGGGSLPLVMTWKGEPKFDIPQKSTPITKDLEGSWDGSLDVKGTILRLVLKLANGPEGATAVVVSLDQNALEIPVATVTQEGQRLKLLITMISGTYEGEVKGGEIAGTWTQGPLNLPLVFKRAAK